jgi:hypothetical protein
VDASRSLEMVKLARAFMYLGGLDESPDSMPWVLECISENACRNLKESSHEK